MLEKYREEQLNAFQDWLILDMEKDYVNNSRNTNVKVEVFKLLYGYLQNIDANIGYNFTLVKEQSRLDVRKCSFSQRTINVWNKLSTDCVHGSI